MAIPLNVDGTPYSYPQQGDVGYAAQATAWAQAMTTALATAEAAIAALQAQPCAIYDTATAQSLANGAATVINYDTKRVDTDNAVVIGAAWTFTVPAGKGGRYLVSAAVDVVVPAATVIVPFFLRVTAGGTTRDIGINGLATTTAGQTDQPISGSVEFNLTAGQTIQVAVTQFSGAARVLTGGTNRNYIMIQKVP